MNELTREPRSLLLATAVVALALMLSACGGRPDAAGDADSACYGDVLHPAWLLRQANYVVDRSIALGPWIHTASEVVHLGHARIGETLEVRAAVVDLSTHKGNDYAAFDVFVSGREPVMRVRHRAIYRLAAR